jgi:predicted deacetylase
MTIHAMTTATATLDELHQQRAHVLGELRAVEAETDIWVVQGFRYLDWAHASVARAKIQDALVSRLDLIDTAIAHAAARITAMPDEVLPAGIQAIVNRKRAVVTPADFQRAVMATVARMGAA